MIADDELDQKLRHIPNLAERAEVREFVKMAPIDQRISLYSEVKLIKAMLEDMNKPLWKQVMSPMLSVAAIAGAFVAGMNGAKF